MRRFDPKKLKEEGGKEGYCTEVSNRFAALEPLDTEWILIEIGKLSDRISKYQQRESRLL
jgi:hypothetical protein